MRATGIIRRVDHLGRIVLPADSRRALDLEPGTPLEVFVGEGELVLRPYRPGCHVCDAMNNLREYRGRFLCDDCIRGFADGTYVPKA